MEIEKILNKLHIVVNSNSTENISVTTPINGKNILKIPTDSEESYKEKIEGLKKQFKIFREIPAPKRGEFIRLFAEELRENKENLAEIITLESGKIIQEARGEVQEMIDICDFALGLSRQLHGTVIASERKNHNMLETYYPLGIVGIISAFNFPMAVWAWNFALATICGNVTIWKPSEKTPISAIACESLLFNAAKKYEYMKNAEKIHEIIISDSHIGEILVSDKNVNLVSATGSTEMGKKVAPILASRFAKSILELGGNNACIVTNNANIDLALKSIIFGAVGTAGQRCTTTRRAIIAQDIYEEFCQKIISSYKKIMPLIGDPLKEETLIGPLISEDSFNNMQNTLKILKSENAEIFYGNRVNLAEFPNGYYVEPALVKLAKQTKIVKKETFAPILYLIPYKTLEEALEIHNDVPQGLSSSIFSNDIRETEFFRKNSDCGIANVNIGTSGAEIGGAFGGEKETGGGRESGSDAWKNYMRRQTSTIYYGKESPELAQNIKFDLEN